MISLKNAREKKIGRNAGSKLFSPLSARNSTRIYNGNRRARDETPTSAAVPDKVDNEISWTFFIIFQGHVDQHDEKLCSTIGLKPREIQ